jgi:hypothetical protein
MIHQLVVSSQSHAFLLSILDYDDTQKRIFHLGRLNIRKMHTPSLHLDSFLIQDIGPP